MLQKPGVICILYKNKKKVYLETGDILDSIGIVILY